jgi:hypothetical protein
LPADLPFSTFLLDDFYQSQTRSFELHLPQRLAFRFFYDLMYEIAASKDPLVRFLLLAFPFL